MDGTGGVQIGNPGWRGPMAMVRDVVVLTFRGSRSDLERVTGLRFEAALVLIFLAARCVHLSQAAVDLSLVGSYRREAAAVGLGVACLVESSALALVCLRKGTLVPRALLADAVFGLIGLGVMSAATSGMPGRAGSLNWMLPYTVATAAGLGLLAGGDLSRSPESKTARAWPAFVSAVLAATYVLSEVLPHRVAGESLAQVLGNAGNYVVFFSAACLVKFFVRRRLALISSRNAEVTQAAADVAHEAQWRAVAVDVFGPVVELLDRVACAADGDLAQPIKQEADRLISMIEAVRPSERSAANGAAGP